MPFHVGLYGHPIPWVYARRLQPPRHQGNRQGCCAGESQSVTPLWVLMDRQGVQQYALADGPCGPSDRTALLQPIHRLWRRSSHQRQPAIHRFAPCRSEQYDRLRHFYERHPKRAVGLCQRDGSCDPHRRVYRPQQQLSAQGYDPLHPALVQTLWSPAEQQVPHQCRATPLVWRTDHRLYPRPSLAIR